MVQELSLRSLPPSPSPAPPRPPSPSPLFHPPPKLGLISRDQLSLEMCLQGKGPSSLDSSRPKLPGHNTALCQAYLPLTLCPYFRKKHETHEDTGTPHASFQIMHFNLEMDVALRHCRPVFP